jgi:hypothetical protein
VRNPRVSRWKEPSQTDGLLLFAQRLEECLHDYTLDTYKAPALNSHTRCIELMRTIEDVRDGLIMPKTLKPIIEELCDSLDKDTAARALIGPTVTSLREPSWWILDDPKRLYTQAQTLRGFLWKGAYERELRRQIQITILAGTDKQLIQSLALSLVVEWMRFRFSRDYIYYRTRLYFFGMRKVSSDVANELHQFFEYFEPLERTFTVCVRATESLAALGSVIPEEVAQITKDAPAARSNRAREARFLGNPHSGVFVIVPDVKALDARSARDEALRRLENILTLAYYHIHRTPLSWESDVLVWDGDYPVVLQAAKMPVHKEDECSHLELPGRVNKTIGALGPHGLPKESWMRVRAALGLHASAIVSRDVSVQLTTLWSAVETLIPATMDDARITQITDVLVPILAAHYPKKLFTDLDSSLDRCAGPAYHEALAKTTVGAARWMRCAEIVAIEENEPLRDMVYPSLATNPLLRNRLFNQMKVFCRANTALASIQRHRQRIEWHVRRIYRSRNLMVHAGNALPYREALVENLHSYFHQLVNTLEGTLTTETPPMSIDAAFLSERLHFEQHLKMLRDAKDAKTTSTNLSQVLLGPETRVSQSTMG